MRSTFTLLSLAMSLLAMGAAGCGSGDSASDSGPLEISGTSSADHRIAADLREYIKPCPGAADETASRVQEALEPGSLNPGSRAERRLNREYGGLDGYIEYQQRTCASYQRIAVNDGVITVETTLESVDTKNAAEICNTIHGSDAANRTAGHMVVGEDREVLARCRP